MTTLALSSPLPIFPDLLGAQLDAGYVYIGQVNQNPETVPITVYWDAAGTQPALQPLRTVNGYIARNGNPAQVYIDGDYSMVVRDENRRLVLHAPSAANTSNALIVLQALSAFAASLASTVTGAVGAALIGVKRAIAGAVATTLHAWIGAQPLNPKADFGAAGDGVADDSTPLAACFAAGGVIDLAGGTYRVVTKAVASVARTRVKNGRLLFDGPNTSRLLDITGDNVTFEGVEFDGNGKQPRFSLVYVDANVKRPRFIKGSRFRNMVGTAYGSTPLNQMCALNINPYGVTGFEISNTSFEDITKYNDGSLIAAAVGLGFVGGVYFLPEDGSDPAAAQPTPTQGLISACQFDTIKTILAGGLTDNDVATYDDGDAIRSYEGTGAKQLLVTVTGCTFRNVSKRAVKLRASGGVFMNSTVYASLGAYGMSTVIDLVNQCFAKAITIITTAAVPPLKLVTLANSGDTTNFPQSFGVDDVSAPHAKVGVEITSGSAGPMYGATVRKVSIGACTISGVVTSGTTPSTQSDMVIEDLTIIGSGNNCNAVSLGTAADVTGGWKVSRLKATNADVKIAGVNSKLIDSEITITSSSFAGRSATAALLEFGSGKTYGGRNLIENLTIDAAGLNTGFMTGRDRLTLVNLDAAEVRKFTLKVPEGLDTSKPHYEGFGDDFHVDGFVYTGPGFCRQGHLVASSRWSVKNAVRSGGGACSTSFWSLSSASDIYEFDGISDFRPTTATSVVSATATNGVADNIKTASSNATPGVSGVATIGDVRTF